MRWPPSRDGSGQRLDGELPGELREPAVGSKAERPGCHNQQKGRDSKASAYGLPV